MANSGDNKCRKSAHYPDGLTWEKYTIVFFICGKLNINLKQIII